MTLCVQKIQAHQTYKIRHQVLWPDHPIETCMLSEDDTALHFGGFINGHLVAVASLFPEGEDKIRLRKFAILKPHQKRGFGTEMLQGMHNYLQQTAYNSLWCDARENARNFYQKNGFTISGKRFLKKGIPYFKAQLDL